MEKILNLKQITEIFDGDPTPIQEILLLLNQTIPEFIEKVNNCMNDNDLQQLKFIIHKFKSSCQLVTNLPFIELIKNIEKSDYDNVAVIKSDIEKLIELTHILQREIQETKLAA